MHRLAASAVTPGRRSLECGRAPTAVSGNVHSGRFVTVLRPERQSSDRFVSFTTAPPTFAKSDAPCLYGTHAFYIPLSQQVQPRRLSRVPLMNELQPLKSHKQCLVTLQCRNSLSTSNFLSPFFFPFASVTTLPSHDIVSFFSTAAGESQRVPAPCPCPRPYP